MLFAVPLQAARSPQNGARMKAEMARAGTPDLLLLVPRGRYHGAAIEMKRPGGKVSPEQREFLERLTEYGYATFVCFSFDDAVKVITQYLRP